MLERVEVLEENVKGMHTRLGSVEQVQAEMLKTHYQILENQQEIIRFVGKWKQGALLMLGLGGAATWVIDHFDKVKKFVLP